MRPRSFDTSWLSSVQGRSWIETLQVEQVLEAELVCESAEQSFHSRVSDLTQRDSLCNGDARESSSPRTGGSMRGFLKLHMGLCGRKCLPSSYNTSNYNNFLIQRLAPRIRPVAVVQGTRTLSLNSWFDNVPHRMMDSWFIPRSFTVGESNESRPRSARPRAPSDDMYHATPLRQRSPERAVTPDQRDQPAISSVPAHVNDADNEVLQSIDQIFKPTIEQILNPH